jgi:hypothetical protein
MLRRLQDVRSKGLPFIVAHRGQDGDNTDEVLGFAYASFHHTRSAWRFTVEDSIYIDPNHVRKGALPPFQVFDIISVGRLVQKPAVSPQASERSFSPRSSPGARRWASGRCCRVSATPPTRVPSACTPPWDSRTLERSPLSVGSSTAGSTSSSCSAPSATPPQPPPSPLPRQLISSTRRTISAVAPAPRRADTQGGAGGRGSPSARPRRHRRARPPHRLRNVARRTAFAATLRRTTHLPVTVASSCGAPSVRGWGGRREKREERPHHIIAAPFPPLR